MLTKTRVIVLNSTKYGDRKMFVNTFSEEYGMITFSCPTSSRGAGRGRMNFFQPMNVLEVEFDMKPKTDIHTIREVRIDVPLGHIAMDPYKLSIVIFLAEFLRYALMMEQKNSHIFSFIVSSMKWLDIADDHFSNFHLIFMIKLTVLMGFAPNVEGFSPGAWFDLREGTFCFMAPLHNEVIAPRETAAVSALARMNYRSMHLMKMSREERNLCTEHILHYYRIHHPQFPELRSFSILKELFV